MNNCESIYKTNKLIIKLTPSLRGAPEKNLEKITDFSKRKIFYKSTGPHTALQRKK